MVAKLARCSAMLVEPGRWKPCISAEATLLGGHGSPVHAGTRVKSPRATADVPRAVTTLQQKGGAASRFFCCLSILHMGTHAGDVKVLTMGK